jgi:hypothetical protein
MATVCDSSSSIHFSQESAMQFTNGSIVQFARLLTFVMCLALSRVGLCQLDQHFAADENIETLTVELAVAHDGMELSEPVALDLGFGFPLWLIPRLADEGGPPVFGALPQRANLTQAVPAGERASFAFDVRAVDGSDVLKTNLQLLGGVRVSDISRIGLCAEGRTDWQLELLEIQINGKLFHRTEGAPRHIQDEQALAHIRLREVSNGIESLRADAERLRELVDCGLATDDEIQELADFEEVVVPQLQEQNRIERQLAGSYPWFIDSVFHSPWRNGHLLQSMSVTLVTAPHTGADTSSFVYYSSGGRKYLLSSPASPLTPEHGPQTFQLDLIGGPATAADLRGHNLGMLSNGIPYSAAPDRYHAARLLVEVDGRVVYDSDEVELDRLSLEAIRLIPPAHLDGAGSVVLNTPLPREAIVWEAGSGSGLDLVNGGAQPLPPPTDSTWPDPEPSVVYDDAWAASESHEGFSEGYGPFPGETCFDEEWVTTWEEPWPSGGWEPGSGAGPGGGWGSGGDPWGVPPWGWGPPPSWLDILAGLWWGHGSGGGGPGGGGWGPGGGGWGPGGGSGDGDVFEDFEEFDADPIGEPIQIENVRFDAEDMSIAWDVVGDDSQVEEYLVEWIVLRPQSLDPLGAAIFSERAFPEERSHSILGIDHAVLVAEVAADGGAAYLIPSVAPRFVSDAGYGPGQLGAAVPVASLGFGVVGMHAAIPVFEYLGGTAPISFGDSFDRRAVWLPGTVVSHSGFAFASGPSWNMVMRPEPGDPWLRYTFTGTDHFNYPVRIVMNAGFMDEVTGLGDTATFEVSGYFTSDDGMHDRMLLGGPLTIVGPLDSEDPQPMGLIIRDFDPEGAMGILNLHVTVQGGDLDPNHPPLVVGLRVIPWAP